MNCLINLLAMCIFDPSNVYIKPSIDYVVSGWQLDPVAKNGIGRYTEGAWCGNRFCRGAIGSLELGVQMPIKRNLTLTLRVKHTSFLLESDRGHESVGADLVYYPFGRD